MVKVAPKNYKEILQNSTRESLLEMEAEKQPALSLNEVPFPMFHGSDLSEWLQEVKEFYKESERPKVKGKKGIKTRSTIKDNSYDWAFEHGAFATYNDDTVVYSLNKQKRSVFYTGSLFVFGLSLADGRKSKIRNGA